MNKAAIQSQVPYCRIRCTDAPQSRWMKSKLCIHLQMMVEPLPIERSVLEAQSYRQLEEKDFLQMAV